MNLTIQEAKELATAVVQASEEMSEAEIVLIPPFTALRSVQKVVARTPIHVGAQDLFWEDRGAFTGEISAPMLKNVGCHFVVIGHSERRQFFGDTDAIVRKKITGALKSMLNPIVCVGETLNEREEGKTMDRIQAQLWAGLEDLTADEFRQVVLAYEPVWAIGTGRTADPGQAEKVHAFIRETLSKTYGKDAAGYAIILYGGSVKPANSYSLFREKNIDGFLVGGASLEAESFIQITKEAIRAYKEET